MPVEIERKFLVATDQWRSLCGPASIVRQGYLSRDPDRVVRVRQMDDCGFVTIKGRMEKGSLRRSEFEYPIPLEDAVFMLENLCIAPIIHKRRSIVIAGDGTRWEIDEFVEPRKGLVLAEVELNDSSDRFEIPAWLGREVTEDMSYSNNNIGLAGGGRP